MREWNKQPFAQLLPTYITSALEHLISSVHSMDFVTLDIIPCISRPFLPALLPLIFNTAFPFSYTQISFSPESIFLVCQHLPFA